MKPEIVIAATGSSLSREVTEIIGSTPVIAVNDAWRLFPSAILYAADFIWWRHYADDLNAFRGRRITCRCDVNGPADVEQLRAWGVEILPIDHGQCSGYGAIQAAIYLGYRRIVLIGYDGRVVAGKRHFFGDHPPGLRNADPAQFLPDFEHMEIPAGVEVLNTTLGSALRTFPFCDLTEALCPTTRTPNSTSTQPRP